MTHMGINAGLCSVTLRSLSIEEVIRTATDAGLAGIEWGSDVHVHDAASAARARSATEAAGLRILSFGSYYRAGSFGAFEQVLDLAAGLGASRIRIWAGDMGSAEASGAHWDAVVEDTQRIAGLAAARGATLAFEYHGGTLTDSPASTLELLRRVDRRAVGTYWQPAVGLDEEQAMESLRQVIGHVVGVHCFSWWPDTARLPLAARKELWRGVAGLLLANGTRLDVMLEFVEGDLPANVIRDAACVRRLLGEALDLPAA